ncbi:uncharacterized protein RJT21DRAFT_126725 [Scheffersomyces amazonensis]|uniref:uncharacterized protein n=1 Tax=Scheffersomyces amazonensis TaxID=1078765 RepID=UPI00315D6C73
MVNSKLQCKGITLKGLRCKLKAPVGQEFCHYHKDQSGPQFSNKRRDQNNDTLAKAKTKTKTITKTEPIEASTNKIETIGVSTNSDKAGYIYVYTLSFLLQPNKNEWLSVKNLPKIKSRHHNKWVPFNSKTSEFILVKIGMTTKSVQERLFQWKSKCNHDLTVVVPSKSDFVSDRQARVGQVSLSEIRDFRRFVLDLTKLFNRLAISDSNTSKAKDTLPHYESFRNQGFYCPKNVRSIESTIHKTLHKKYGGGSLYCTGCSENAAKRTNKSNKSTPFNSDYNIHVEWFLIPKSDLTDAFKLIDDICVDLSK